MRAILGDVPIDLGERVLDEQRALYRLDDTAERGQNVVAGGIDDPAVMERDMVAKYRARLIQRCDRRRVFKRHKS